MTSTTTRPTAAAPPPGPAAPHEQLAAWRDAAASGALPTPALARWQPLRAGVVNLWEFDVAEYWFADGRAQFVGANQSGKSTLMALTTLIMLAGDLDRQYVDTFGQQDKSFRYYVEPTDDDRDRRETTSSTNRGWAWVEYGRLGPAGPEYYTTLLYAQAKRGVKTLTRVWIVCRGEARIRAGLHLAAGQATTTPAELTRVPGVQVCGSGTEYAGLLAGDLFGFSDADRLATVLEMLKVLRTPHLGQKLNPDWFTAQMRAALPAVARAEVDELAEGWTQLEQLGRDRDSAAEARDAVANYLRRVWRPWADAVLRRAADELITANTGVDNVTRRVREAQTKLEQAQNRLQRAAAEHAQLVEKAEHAGIEYEELLRSTAYQDATARTQHAENLEVTAARLACDAAGRREDADRARQALDDAQAAYTAALAETDAAEQSLTSAAARTLDAVRGAGFAEEVLAWADGHDTDRLEVALADRRAHLRRLRALLRAAEKAQGAVELAARRVTDAETAYTQRAQAASDRAAERDEALQQLSDAVEAWAAALTTPPDPAQREAWIAAVTEQAGQLRPRAVLRERLRTQWLDPATGPLRERAGQHAARAEELRGLAEQAAREADEQEAAPDPIPPAPAGWTRRLRPAFPGPAGAPLWRLLDPVDGLAPAVLDHVEAALTAAGLLDAWVTADGVWLPDREDADVVATLTVPTPPPGTDTLAAVLQPAADAGPLTDAALRVLYTVGFAAAGADLPAVVAVSADGRWRTPTTTGLAARSEHGAEQLGSAARAAARARAVADLRARAARHRADAADAADAAEQLRTQIRALQEAFDAAPDDATVMHAAVAAAHADRERAAAERTRDTRRAELTDAEAAAARADADVLNHAAEHSLPSDRRGADDAEQALHGVAAAVSDLKLAARDRQAAGRRHDDALAHRQRSDAERTRAEGIAAKALVEAEQAQRRAAEAAAALGRDDQDLLHREKQLREERDLLGRKEKAAASECDQLQQTVTRAEEQLAQQDEQRDQAEARRTTALTAWWVPVDAGLAAARGLPAAPGRNITAGRDQAQAARAQLRPQNWPESPDATAEKNARVDAAWSRLTGTQLMELRAVLESTGGRSVSVADAEETGGLPAVLVLVDASGEQLSPTEAIGRLDDQVTELARLHDEKMHQVLVELLSSTFVEHLRDRLTSVVALIERVNRVLAHHPTGANRTTLRLRRMPAEGQRAGFDVLRTLERGFVDAPDVQEQVREFLAERIREAQELGRAAKEAWTEHLATLLDYRRWFDVTAEFRVGDGEFKPLTRQVHGTDSGGGKVVTLLQPLLATLVALYDESPTAPRPLWLDEAFEGVDPTNRATMLDLLVDFGLDFLLAGPGTLVTAAQVPAAAVWFVSRAPAPLPGVDLSLMLWAGRTLTPVPLPDLAADALRPRPEPDADDLFSTLADAGPAA